MEAIAKRQKSVHKLGRAVTQTILFVITISFMYNDNLLISAQLTEDNGTSSSQANQTRDTDASRLNSDNNDNLNIEGIILPDTANTTVQREELILNQNLSSVSDPNSSSLYKISGGTWKLDVINGNVEYFNSNLTMVTPTGTDMHDHFIEFRSDDPEVLLLSNNTAVINIDPAMVEIAALNLSQGNKTQDNSNITSVSWNDSILAFSGIADIQTNGVIEWREIPVSVSIFNGSVINVKIDPSGVNSHFSGTPIDGLVTSVEPIVIIQNRTG